MPPSAHTESNPTVSVFCKDDPLILIIKDLVTSLMDDGDWSLDLALHEMDIYYNKGWIRNEQRLYLLNWLEFAYG